MQAEFWLERWRTGQIGFHEGRPNGVLVARWAELRAGPRVLVPLCGKTHDLDWLLARGHEVIGVELAELAIQAWFEERGLRPEREGPVWRWGTLRLVQGDFFDTHIEFDAFYDRAALIAIDPARRAEYAARLRGRPGLLVTLDYPQAQRQGPPWSVPEEEVRALFPTARRVHEEDLSASERARGLSWMREIGFLIDGE